MLKNKKLISVLISILVVVVITSFVFIGGENSNNQSIPTKLITSVHSDLPFKFETEEKNIILKPGEVQTINYSVENLSKKSISAMATFQVYPPELKDYMTKVNCFCYIR